MPQGPLPSCLCIGSYNPTIVLQWIYCQLLQIAANTGGGGEAGGEFTSTTLNDAASGSIPAGVLAWSASAISGTITVNGAALPVGASVGGGGYVGRVSSAAIPYTVAGGGSVLISYDT